MQSYPASPKQLSARSARIRDRWQNHIMSQQANYCRQHQLNANYFNLWKRKLRSPDSQVTSSIASKAIQPKLIPMVFKPNPVIQAVAPSQLSVKAMLPNGVSIGLLLRQDIELLPVLTQLAQLSC